MSVEPRPPGPDVPRRMGRYELGRCLGEGGMGVVYHATRDDGRQVAIKVLRPHIAHDPGSRRRLEREVSSLERVHSPRVAAVLDADVDGPAPYLVTEYVPGVPLDTIVAEHGPLSGPLLVRLGRGLLEALEAIHQAGIVHRDLKPGNVLMVGRDPIVIDFGIAQVADDSRLTMTGMVMGTPGYLSPEVVEGGSVTEATDQWGWAATLAFAASGQPPFGRGPMPAVLDRVIRGAHRLDGVDPSLRPLLAAALDPDPGQRPSAQEVMRALELYAAHRPVTEALPQVDPTRVQPVAYVPQTRELQPPPVPGPWSQPRGAPVTAPPAPYRGGVEPGPTVQPIIVGGGDPRIGKPPRTGTIAAGLALVVGLAAVLPALAWTLIAVWSVAARTTDQTVTALVMRRHVAGPRRSDTAVAVLAGPWHLLLSVLGTGLALLLPVGFAIATSVITAGVLTQTGVLPADIDHPVPLALGTALGAVIAWWGPGGVSLRRGSRTMTRALLPRPLGAQVGVMLLVAAGAGLLWWALLHTGAPSWWPIGDRAPFAGWAPSVLRP